MNVLLAHLLVAGARVGGGERQLHLGQIYAVTPQQLPTPRSTSRSATSTGPSAWRPRPWRSTPGSLLQLDFGEVDQDKRVMVVEAHPGRPVEVRSVPLTAGRPLVDVPGTLDELPARADEPARRVPARRAPGAAS